MPQQNLSPITLIPGFNKNVTAYEAANRIIDGNNVRFREGKPEKVGGWTEYTVSVLPGVARDAISWTDLDSNPYLAAATNERVEILYQGTYYDITPFVNQVSVSSGVTTTSGSSNVEVTWATHTLDVGDIVNIKNASVTVGGNILLDGDYTVTSIPSASSFLIDSGVIAAASSTSAGGNFSVGQLLPAGNEYNQLGFGYGSGTYGHDGYGASVSSSGVIIKMRQWALDNWGEDLLAIPRGGRLYTWDATNGVAERLQLVSASPSVTNFGLVTPSRQVMLFGCTNEAGDYDPLTFRWSNVEDYTIWTTSAGSTAGEDRFAHGSQAVGAELSKVDIIGFTDTAAYRLFQTPNIAGSFSQELLSENAGLIAQHASINVDGAVEWMSDHNFHRYDGTMVTLDCTIRNKIFDSNSSIAVNKGQKEMIFCGINKEFREIIYLYPAGNSNFCNRYIIHNYAEDLWYDGDIERSVWVDADTFDKPIAVDNDGVTWQHETGYNAGSVALSAWFMSGYTDINNGDQLMFVDKFIPDLELTGNSGHTITLMTKRYPQDTTTTSKTYVVTQNLGKVNTRIRGRQLAVRWDSNGLNSYFRFGKPRIAASPDGER